jgi:hypothetical protein
MSRAPEGYQKLKLNHHEDINNFLRHDPPQTSELTFTNLYMWRGLYRPVWKKIHGCLAIIMRPQDEEPYALPPVVGPEGDAMAALSMLMDDLGDLGAEPRACRVGADFVDKHLDRDRFQAELDRDQSDYVYLAQELIDLSGKRFHKKKNHLNKFLKNNEFTYKSLDQETIECVLEMQESWCQLRDCQQDENLMNEDRAIFEALTHFDRLDYVGGAIVINEVVEAFSLGEPLNQDTAVIHIEKANPEIPGLYAAINQMFAANAWSGMTYINREQDLGVPGLRKAKESYQPHQMVDKYVVTPIS